MSKIYKVTYREYFTGDRNYHAGWSRMTMVELFETDDINKLNERYSGEGRSNKKMVDVEVLTCEKCKPKN